jgi:hypothetical protein
MRYLSILFLIFIFVANPSCKFLRERGLLGGKEKTLASLLTIQDSIRVADSLSKAKDRILAMENAKIDSARKAGEQRISMEMKFRYNIIVGSFTTPGYAEGLAEKYRKKGYNPGIIKLKGGSFELVSLEGYEDLGKALSRLKVCHDSLHAKAWLYKRD